MAIYLGFDPSPTNSSMVRRGGTLLVDFVIYTALITTLAVLGSIMGSSDSGVMVLLLSLFLGLGGFCPYRVTGGPTFDGSPGKCATGMRIEGAHGMPVSVYDGFVRNVWVLLLMIPVVDWFASAGLVGWITMGTSRDPLG